MLQDISLTARPGTTTAVVGSTGSGKSTLVSLICRMYDVTGGSVRLDGVDVREYDPEHLWSVIGLVPQRGYLFSGTVADNLQLGAVPGHVATEDEMWEALRVAAADDFVRAHADDLALRVAQGGANFSGGQRQRLAIARAVIRRPAVYLFDDAFSALDVHTDTRVRLRCARCRRMRRSSLSHSASPPSHRQIRSSSSTTVGSSAWEPTKPCWRNAPSTQSSPIRSRSPKWVMRSDGTDGAADPRHGAATDPAVPRLHRIGDPTGQAAHPQRGLTAAVILLGVGGIAISVIGPRILGHATDLLFNGVIGRQLPAGLTKGRRSRPRGPMATTPSPTCCRG